MDNDTSGGLLAALDQSRLKHVVAAHLSRRNNAPELARSALAKALKRHGFVFVGPTTLYAGMQANGLVDDHLVGCFRRGPSPA